MYSGVSLFSEHFILHSVSSVASHTLPHNNTVAIQYHFSNISELFNQHNLLLLAYIGDITVYKHYLCCERFEPRSHFKRLSLIARVNVVSVDSD